MNVDNLHSYINTFFIVQTAIALSWCISNKRWVHIPHRSNVPCIPCQQDTQTKHRHSKDNAETPTNTDPNSLSLKQFQLQLIVHSLFYLYELCFTDMFTSYPSMAIHHQVAFAIFFVYLNDIGTISVATLLPFLFHNSFWVLYPFLTSSEDENNTILYFKVLGVYNAVLISVGFTCLLNSFTIVAWDNLAVKFAATNAVLGPATTLSSSNSSSHHQPPLQGYQNQHPKPRFLSLTPHILGILATLEACVNYYSFCDHDHGTVLCVPRGYFMLASTSVFLGVCLLAWLGAFLMVLEGAAPLGVLLGQKEGAAGGFWCCVEHRDVDWKNMEGFSVLKRLGVRKVKEE
ncbi:hypothetical protein BDR26DRAFT_857800 [Obelidium mucronatum]|nr:hypothetical protein BDR26DRAFT_857800 [Obelidium mucronatum]